jgi:hypothetical protein
MTYRKEMRLALACLAALAPTAACGPDDTTGPCKDDLVAGDLVVTEVFADFAAPAGGTGTDDGKEWFEIYNNADRPVSLKGLTVVHSRPDGSKAQSHTMIDVTIAPGQYFTLGNATSDLVPPYVDYGYSASLGDFYNSDGGKLALKCGDSEIDAAVYDTVKSGHSRQLTNAGPPDYTLNDDPNSWCEAKDTEFETNNFGTPGQDNDCAPIIAGACSDGGTMRDAIPPGIGDLVITEVMPKPTAVSATTGQWFEIKAMKDVDLNGVGLDRASDTSNPTELASPTCIHMAAGSYAVFARSADMNGGLTTLGTFPFSINPTTVTPDVQLVYGGTVIDSVSWPTSTSGRSRSLDPDFTTASANDDPANFCDGQAVYFTDTMTGDMDRGTPGAVNEQCAAQPGPGQCLDAGVPRAIVKPAAGTLVINEFLANAAGTGTDNTQEWFEIVNTGSTPFDLNDLGIQGGTTTIYPIQSVNCKSVPAGGFALFAHGTDPALNGGLNGVDLTFTFALGSTIKVHDGCSGSPVTCTTLVDQVTFGSTGDGLSKQLKLANANVTDNDTIGNFCDADPAAMPSQMYGTAANYGTPKAANVCP